MFIVNVVSDRIVEVLHCVTVNECGELRSLPGFIYRCHVRNVDGLPRISISGTLDYKF